jgi:hypothetical protein
MPSNPTNGKQRLSYEQRIRRRNQVLFLVFSGFLILAMLLSLVNF